MNMNTRRLFRNTARGPVFLALIGCVAACTIQQQVTPVDSQALADSEVCIIEDPAVRPGFLVEMLKALRDLGYATRKLPADAGLTDCPTVVTYTARWSWDLTIYMSYSEIVVYSDGSLAGKALYDATGGGGRMDKFIDAEPKIRELVRELFPPSGNVIAQ
jgi:hypothetical protein